MTKDPNPRNGDIRKPDGNELVNDSIAKNPIKNYPDSVDVRCWATKMTIEDPEVGIVRDDPAAKEEAAVSIRLIMAGCVLRKNAKAEK